MNAFFQSQFNFCPTVWMLNCHLQGSTFSSEELVGKDDFVSVHHKNAQTIATGMSKVANGMSEIINELFQLREESHYNLPYSSRYVIPTFS